MLIVHSGSIYGYPQGCVNFGRLLRSIVRLADGLHYEPCDSCVPPSFDFNAGPAEVQWNIRFRSEAIAWEG